MTTTVIIKAHLIPTKEVKVLISEYGNAVEEFSLQDGEDAERYIYDGREIVVKEVEKQPV